jgi:hypothetical protein
VVIRAWPAGESARQVAATITGNIFAARLQGIPMTKPASAPPANAQNPNVAVLQRIIEQLPNQVDRAAVEHAAAELSVLWLHYQRSLATSAQVREAVVSEKRDRMKSDIVRRRIREMYPAGFTVQDIAAVVERTNKHVRNLILQEFPDGRPASKGSQPEAREHE